MFLAKMILRVECVMTGFLSDVFLRVYDKCCLTLIVLVVGVCG